MRGHSFENDGDILSFLDAGGDGKPLLALHGHWMGASDFAGVAEDLSPEWRVIALDQRGFGETDHGAAHSIAAYIGDVVALLDRGFLIVVMELNLEPMSPMFRSVTNAVIRRAKGHRGEFIEHAETVVLLDDPGTGKTGNDS